MGHCHCPRPQPKNNSPTNDNSQEIAGDRKGAQRTTKIPRPADIPGNLKDKIPRSLPHTLYSRGVERPLTGRRAA
jgi:hypothetical protein